jgi:eukaryotic-like serine/threonine-protein kinase
LAVQYQYMGIFRSEAGGFIPEEAMQDVQGIGHASTHIVPYEQETRAFVPDGQEDPERLTLEESLEDSLSDKDIENLMKRLEGSTVTSGTGRRYHLTKQLGRGGMGMVFLADREHKGLDVTTRVAVKLMLPGRGSATSMARFEREMELLFELDENPFILSPRDRIVVDVEGISMVGLVTEYIQGGDLADALTTARYEADGHMEISSAMDYTAQLAVALETLREKGIVHRDLKPDNIFFKDIGGRRFAKLGDFGLAMLENKSENAPSGVTKLEERVAIGEKLTQQGSAIGTPAFMSPEQVMAKPLTHKSDVFALGTLMFVMLTGQYPFDGNMGHIRMSNIALNNRKTFEDVGVGYIPKPIQRLVFAMMDPNPSLRPEPDEIFQKIKQMKLSDFPDQMDHHVYTYDFSKRLADREQAKPSRQPTRNIRRVAA